MLFFAWVSVPPQTHTHNAPPWDDVKCWAVCIYFHVPTEDRHLSAEVGLFCALLCHCVGHNEWITPGVTASSTSLREVKEEKCSGDGFWFLILTSTGHEFRGRGVEALRRVREQQRFICTSAVGVLAHEKQKITFLQQQYKTRFWQGETPSFREIQHNYISMYIHILGIVITVRVQIRFLKCQHSTWKPMIPAGNCLGIYKTIFAFLKGLP